MDRRVEKHLVHLMVDRSGDVQHAFRWEDEKALLELIRTGKPERIGSVLEKHRAAYQQTMGDVRFSADRQRERNYMLVSALTLFCRAAIEGGVPETLAYSMMESYIYCADRYPDDFFLDALYAFAEAVAGQRTRSGTEDPQVRKIRDYILNNLNNPITLGSIAAHMRLSPSRCSHLFREKTGMTIHRFLERERIAASFAYLAYSDRPVSWLSEYLTFSNPSHFTSVFRKYAGMTPTEWRRKNRITDMSGNEPHEFPQRRED